MWMSGVLCVDSMIVFPVGVYIAKIDYIFSLCVLPAIAALPVTRMIPLEEIIDGLSDDIDAPVWMPSITRHGDTV
jgi:hypothetical protein